MKIIFFFLELNAVLKCNWIGTTIKNKTFQSNYFMKWIDGHSSINYIYTDGCVVYRCLTNLYIKFYAALKSMYNNIYRIKFDHVYYTNNLKTFLIKIGLM